MRTLGIIVTVMVFWLMSSVSTAAVKPVKPKVLDMAKVVSVPFLDVALEKRCEALSAFFLQYAKKYLKDVKFEDKGCGEGNGFGGARYNYDFGLVKKEVKKTYRFMIGPKKTLVRLCDTNARPVVCSINHIKKPLKFGVDKKRFKTKKEAAGAVAEFYSLAINLRHLFMTTQAWISKKQTKKTIYGVDYPKFVRKIVANHKKFPILTEKKAGVVGFKLIPESKSKPDRGTVELTGEAGAAFLGCFKCEDSDCFDEDVKYKFMGRLLSLTRFVTEKKGQKAAYGAGWLIEGADPLAKDGQQWKYVCDAARYSLQNIPAKKK